MYGQAYRGRAAGCQSLRPDSLERELTRAVYFDCFSGASGDMLLGALVDAGVALDDLRSGLASLPVSGWTLSAERAEQHGIGGTRVRVQLDAVDHPHRGLSQVLSILDASTLDLAIRNRARRIFERLAEVESSIHGTAVEDVEFHEVGAVDAIVDVTGVVLGLSLLNVDWQQITCSGLPTGSGWVRSQHGPLPVPAPATLELLRRARAPLRRVPTDTDTGELLTPTGAALLTTLARFESPANVTSVEAVGYGFGTREMAWPNAVRVWVGTAAPASTILLRDQV